MKYEERRELLICILELITNVIKTEKKISSIRKKKHQTTKT